MSLHEPTGWIICYDIRDKRRLGRVHRHVRKWGVPLQYSVFMVQASATLLYRLMGELDEIIDRRVDDVRAYRFPPRSECHMLGAPFFPDGVLLQASSALPYPQRISVKE